MISLVGSQATTNSDKDLISLSMPHRIYRYPSLEFNRRQYNFLNINPLLSGFSSIPSCCRVFVSFVWDFRVFGPGTSPIGSGLRFYAICQYGHVQSSHENPFLTNKHVPLGYFEFRFVSLTAGVYCMFTFVAKLYNLASHEI